MANSKAHSQPATEAEVKEKPLAQSVKEDLKGTPEGQLSPANFVEVIEEHAETERPQALRNVGDGTQSVWPAQPVPDRREQTDAK